MGNRQPNPYGFNGKTTANAVVAKLGVGEEWKNRVVLITGTTHGIGWETFKAFALMPNPPTIITLNRNVDYSRTISADLEKNNNQLKTHHLQVDLGSRESINNCVNEFKSLNLNLNILLLNAGVFFRNYQVSKDGMEAHFSINHVGHFYLTNQLLEHLERGAEENFKSRVIVVASHSHYRGDINFDELPLTEKTFGGAVSQKGYALSKLCNVLFSNELNRRLVAENKPIRANSLHPASMTYTNLGNESSVVRSLFYVCSFFTRTVEQAAATSLYCSVSPDLENVGGKYFDECCELEASKTAQDETIAKRLWEFTDSICQKE